MRLALRLDKGSKTASAILDDAIQASLHYAPSNFKVMNSIWVGASLSAVKPPKWHYGGGHPPLWVSGKHVAAAKYEMVDLGALTHLPDSQAIAINNKGLVLFGDQSGDDSSRFSLFLWQNGKVRALKPRGYLFAALNDRGQIAGVRIADFDKLTGSTVLWQNGRITKLGAIGKSGLVPSSINNRGQIAGVFPIGNGCRAVVWEKGRLRFLTTPAGALNSCAGSINARGQVAGGVTDAHKIGHAYVWRAGKGSILECFRPARRANATPSTTEAILWEHPMARMDGIAEEGMCARLYGKTA